MNEPNEYLTDTKNITVSNSTIYPSSFVFAGSRGAAILTVRVTGEIEIGEGYTPFEAGDAFIAAMPQAFARATQAAAEQERAAVVAFIRKVDAKGLIEAGYYFGDAVERGEHLKDNE